MCALPSSRGLRRRRSRPPIQRLYTQGLSAIWPYWRSVKADLGYPEIAHYVFQPRGGYVEMCKTYRRHSEKAGRLVTLKQRIAANPEVQSSSEGRTSKFRW